MANHVTRLKPGDKAPDFEGTDTTGKTVTLHDLLANSGSAKKLVLYFYPKDDTPGCTAEACNLRDNYAELRRQGYTVVGVSADDVKKHQKFAGKYKLPFLLLSDPELKIIKAYDVWGEKLFMGRVYDGIVRTTFVINDKGILEDVITKVKSKEHAAQILEGSGR